MRMIWCCYSARASRTFFFFGSSLTSSKEPRASVATLTSVRWSPFAVRSNVSSPHLFSHANMLIFPLPSLFSCQQVDFPITYLGVPLSIGKLSRSVWQMLIDRVADKLSIWKGALMHRAGRLALIKTTLSTIPIYTSICLGLPA
jgi:hypothetical protein